MATYPRTLDKDCALLEPAGCDYVFAPTEAEMYPEPDTRTFDFGTIKLVYRMDAKKILFIAQEITPYLPESEIATICRNLPQGIQERGREIRTFMPKFGNINERRNQLHEVIRLSGMNLIIAFLRHGSSAYILFMYNAVSADIHPWQWITSGIQRSFFTVSSTPRT